MRGLVLLILALAPRPCGAAGAGLCEDAAAARRAGRLEEAVALFRKAAGQGQACGQWALGYYSQHGQGGVKKDLGEAKRWYRLAAEQGHAESQFWLGYFAVSEKNYPEAVKWYAKAAAKGHDMAQNNLGSLYDNGWGVPENQVEAYRWISIAASRGNATAMRNKGYLERRMTRGQVAEAQRRAAGLDGGPQAAVSLPLAPGPAIDKEEMRRLMKEAVQEASAKPKAEELRSDVDEPGYKAAENPDDYALVVGIEKYSSDIPDAQFAERDAKAVREHLLALGFPARNIVFLDGPQATRTGLAKNLETWLPNHVGEDSTVFFYYSGHGTPDPKSGQAYLVPWDGDVEYLQETAYPLRRLYERLAALKASKIVVALDSCFSGLKGRSVLPKDVKPLVNKVSLGIPGHGKVISLTASRSNQVSSTLEEQGHGTFTYFLLKGLNGAAAGKDGAVTVKGLYGYLAPKVEDAARRQNHDQTPELFPAALGEAADVALRRAR